MDTKTEQISVDPPRLSQLLDGRSTVLTIPRPHSFRRSHLLLNAQGPHPSFTQSLCVSVCGDITLLWFNCGYVVLKRWGSYLGKSSLFYTDWLMGLENVTKHKLCFIVVSPSVVPFCFSFGQEVLPSPLWMLILFFHSKFCLKIVLLLLHWEIKDWWSCGGVVW